MIKRIKQRWKSLLCLLISTVVAGFLFYTGWLDERFLVVLGLGGFIVITLAVIIADKVIKKNADKIQQLYNKQQYKRN